MHSHIHIYTHEHVIKKNYILQTQTFCQVLYVYIYYIYIKNFYNKKYKTELLSAAAAAAPEQAIHKSIPVFSAALLINYTYTQTHKHSDKTYTYTESRAFAASKESCLLLLLFRCCSFINFL